MEKLWNTVEISTLSLLETQFAAHAHNKQSLVDFFISINWNEKTIDESNESIEELKDSIENNLGIERNMNQSIRFCIEDLNTYIENTQRIST